MIRQALAILAIACVTPEEFGAVGDGLTDDYEAIQAAADYCVDSCVSLSDHPFGYFSSETIKARACSVLFVGQNGHGRDYATSIRFPPCVAGLRAIGAGKWSASIGVAWIGRRASNPSEVCPSVHGIEISTNLFLDRTYVADFEGSGVHSDCDGPTNCNTLALGTVWSETNGSFGYFLNGSDGNAFDAKQLSAVENRLGGVRDESFLGGHYGSLHLDSGPYTGLAIDFETTDPNNSSRVDWLYLEGGNGRIKLSAHATIGGGNFNFNRTEGLGSFTASGVQWGSQSFINNLDPNRLARMQFAASTHEGSCFFEAAIETANEVQIGQPLRMCNSGRGAFTLGQLRIGDGTRSLRAGEVSFDRGVRVGADGQERLIHNSSGMPSGPCKGGDLMLNNDAKGSAGCWAYWCKDDTRTWQCARFGP